MTTETSINQNHKVMKKLIPILIAALSFAFIFASCKEEEEKPTKFAGTVWKHEFNETDWIRYEFYKDSTAHYTSCFYNMQGAPIELFWWFIGPLQTGAFALTTKSGDFWASGDFNVKTGELYVDGKKYKFVEYIDE
jgi:hypothetical protein